MIGGPFTSAFFHVYMRAGDVLGQRWRGQLKINAHSFILFKAPPLVIKVGVALIFGKPARDLFEAGLLEHLEGGALGFGDMCLAAEGLDIPYVLIARGDIEIAG